MKISLNIWVILLIFISATSATATIQISNPNMRFHTSGGATINFTDNTTLDALQWGGTYLNATVNGSKIGFSGSAIDTLISKLLYQTSPEKLTFNASATSGTLNIDTDMAQGNSVYIMYVNGSQYLVRTVDATGKSQYFLSTWGGDKNISIQPGAWTPVSNTIYFVDYTYDCAMSGGNVDIMANKVPLFLVVILLIFIVKFPSNSGTNLVGAIVVVFMVVLLMGNFMPDIVNAANSCGEKNRETIDVGGRQGDSIALAHSNIVSASEKLYNGTYTAVRDTDYTIDYTAGAITPLESGNLYFGS